LSTFSPSTKSGSAAAATPRPAPPPHCRPAQPPRPHPSLSGMTRRRFIADSWTATPASLTGDQAIHLARVLRAEPGQIYDIVANGFLHRAEIISVTEHRVDFTLHEELYSDAALPL